MGGWSRKIAHFVFYKFVRHASAVPLWGGKGYLFSAEVRESGLKSPIPVAAEAGARAL
jgi:hypothetical protein